MIVGVLRRPLHPDDFPVLHVAVQPAVVAGAANGAQGVLDFNPRVLAGDFCLESFLTFCQESPLPKI